VRFDELPLYEAIYDVYRTIDSPRSETWLYEPQKEELLRRIQRALPLDSPFSSRQMVEAWITFGKSGSVQEGVKKVELAVVVGRVHGKRCFFFGRGLGDCSVEMSIDRIVPGSHGGKYTIENCILACCFHNSQRNDRSIEDYLVTAEREAT
jgi:hypothetical protein